MGGKNRKGMSCRVLVTKGNKVLVEMADGELVVTMRYAVRQAEPPSSQGRLF